MLSKFKQRASTAPPVGPLRLTGYRLMRIKVYIQVGSLD